jgi:hypothetical protein
LPQLKHLSTFTAPYFLISVKNCGSTRALI